MTKNEIYQQYRQWRKGKLTWEEWQNVAEQSPNGIFREMIETRMKAEKRLMEYMNSPYFRFKIRKYCNMRGYTDIHPYEVIKVISPISVVIRAMHTEQTVFPKDFHPGGFSGHYADNRNQDYIYSSDPNGQVIRLRLGKKGWGKGKYHMADKPHMFYDYNF